MIDENQINLIKYQSAYAGGFRSEKEKTVFTCIFCGKRFEKGMIYELGDNLLEAERAVRDHVKTEHGDPFYLLLDLGKEFTGLSDIQRDVVRGMYEGHSDKETAKALGGKAVSTVRNHRFHLRRQKREALVFLAIMELIEGRDGKGDEFIQFHGDLPVHDERTIVTRTEANTILKKYVEPGDKFVLRQLPRKQKEKLVLLNRISELFSPEKRYSEKEINTVLSAVHEEYVEIRRYLVDYRFLERKPDGSEYWVLS